MARGELYTPSSANVGSVDRRLVDIVRKAAAEYGLGVSVTPSGGAVRGKRSRTSKHVTGQAIDISLTDARGNVLPNYQSPQTFQAYEQFAQTARNIQLQDYPELTNSFRWGGYFGGALGKTYGAMDLMHFDLGPTSAMAAGSWETGLKPKYAKAWGVQSVGMGELPAATGGPVPPAEVSSIGSRTLKKGMKGNDVAALQAALNRDGFNVAVDGRFGAQTEAALKAFQASRGLEADGVVGRQTRTAVVADMEPAMAPPIPHANPVFAPPDLQTALNAAAAREKALRNAPRVEPVANVDLNQQAFEPQGRISAALTPVERAPLADITPTLASPRDNLAPPHIGPGPFDQVPRTSAAPIGPVERGPSLPDITPRYASARDNFAPPHIGPDPDPLGLNREISQSRAQMDAMRQAIDEGWSIDAARIRSGMDQPNPVPRANPLREISIGANSPLADSSLDTAPRIQARPDFDYTVGPADAPVGGVADLRRSPDFDFAVGPADAPVNSAADLRRTPDFDFAVGPANQSAPPAAASSPAPTSFPVGNSPVGATGLPDSALRGLQMNFAPAEMSLADFASRYDPLANAPKTSLPALPSRNVGYAPGMTPLAGVPQTAQPQVYQPTSPVGGPTLDELAYGAMPPGAAAASAAPVGKKPGMISNILSNPLARAGIGYLTGGPLGAAIGLGGALLSGALKGGGFGALGGGFDPATAARNAAYAAGVSQSDMIGGRYGGASYGRTGSDGVTRGTTSSGTGYESRNGGRDVTVGGRSYRERRDGRGYSAVL